MKHIICSLVLSISFIGVANAQDNTPKGLCEYASVMGSIIMKKRDGEDGSTLLVSQLNDSEKRSKVLDESLRNVYLNIDTNTIVFVYKQPKYVANEQIQALVYEKCMNEEWYKK